MADKYDKLLRSYFTGELDILYSQRISDLLEPHMEEDVNSDIRSSNSNRKPVEFRMIKLEEDEWGTNAGSDQNNRDYAVFKRGDGTSFDLDLDPIYTDDDGKSWFTKGGGDHKDSTVEFPYMPGNKDRPEVYLEKDNGDE